MLNALDLPVIWFILIAVLFAGYFLLEGFDFGVGMLLPFLGRDERRRAAILKTIGPVWDGNEVWLITAGGALFAAFPVWYATMFSGFYLPLFLILLGLIVRAVALEWRGKVDTARWRAWCDRGIVAGSWLPPILWGVAVANLVRGVPVRAAAVERHLTTVDRVLDGSAELRVRGELPEALDDARSAARALADADEAAAPSAATSAGLSALAAGLTVTGVLAAALTGWGGGAHPPAWLGVLALLPLAAFESVSALPTAAVAVSGAAGAARRLAELTGPGEARDVVTRPPAPGAEPHVTARGLVCARGGGAPVELGPVDLDVPFGGRETIVAPSGAGKTTLLMTLAGLLPARAGTCSAPGALFLAEDAHVFATTVRDNLAVGAPHATDTEMLDVLGATRFRGRAHRVRQCAA